MVLLSERLAMPSALFGVQLPTRLREYELLLLHVPRHHLPAAKALRRAAMHVPAAYAAGARRGLSEALVNAASRALARKSSRRQLFKFLGMSSLGAGLFLTRTDVTLGSIGGCSGCGGGPCNPNCISPHPVCTNPNFLCKPCAQAGGCPIGCTTTGEWFCCRVTGCRQRCSECSCPTGCCHCFTNINIPCIPRSHSGDQPCQCPPAPMPVRTAA
jgi:hypothetical protein